MVKKIKKYLLFTLGVLALAACLKEESGYEKKDVTVPSEQVEQGGIIPGTVIVKLTEELATALEQSAGMLQTKSAELNSAFQTVGVTKYTRVFDSDPRWVERERREGMHLYYRLDFDPDTAPATKAASDISQVPGVENVEVLYRKKLMYTTTPNDPNFSKEWHLYNSNGYDINVQKVWTEFTQGDPKVIVNVVDGGVKLDHPDLLVNVIPGKAGGSKNFVTNNYTITGHFHGTHVGGTISATTNNGVGVAGIAGGDYATGKKGVQLLCSQVFTDNDSADSFANAIKYGADNGAVISQNSWGYDFDINGDYQISQSEYQNAVRAAQSFPNTSEAKAIDYFIKYAGCDNNGNQLPNSPMKGGIVFFSAGNDNIDVGVPAIYEPCVAVGSYTKAGKKSSFSNYGDWVDICSPGTDIYNTSCGNYGTYTYMSGTSMACPMVSGVAALLVSYRGGQGFTNELLKEALLKAADDKIPSSKIGPMINAYNAMLYKLEPAPDPVKGFTADVQANSITFKWKVQAKPKGGPVDGAILCAAKTKAALEAFNPANPSSDVAVEKIATNKATVGSDATGTIKGLDFGTKYYVTVRSYNTTAYAAIGEIKEVTTGRNEPPVITPLFEPEDLNIRAAETKTLQFSVSDPDGHNFTAQFVKANECEVWERRHDDLLQVTIPAPKIRETGRSYTSTVTLTDEYGLSTVYKMTYNILENHAPEVAAKFDNIVAHVRDKSIKLILEDKFNDPDGDELTYSVKSSSSAIVRVSLAGNTLDLNFGNTSGEVKITVTARDGRDAEATQTFRVLSRAEGENISVYPTQVTSTLTIGTGAKTEDTHIEIYAQSGTLVCSLDTLTSAFKPAEIDMSGMAPGRYHLKVTIAGVTYVKTIVKI